MIYCCCLFTPACEKKRDKIIILSKVVLDIWQKDVMPTIYFQICCKVVIIILLLRKQHEHGNKPYYTFKGWFSLATESESESLSES